MRILLTNDDGIESHGLSALREALAGHHELWVIAPEDERSGSSHGVSVSIPVRVRERDERIYAVDGTPADCVLLGIRFLIPAEVDAVVSGINHGPNLGTDILYSGAVGAARQGALMGKPSYAFSLCGKPTEREAFLPSAAKARELLEIMFPLASAEHFVNVNFPYPLPDAPLTAVCFPSQRIYRDHYESFRAPDGSLYCFLSAEGSSSVHEPGSDFHAIEQGRIAVSPLAVRPINHAVENRYRMSIAERNRNEL
ncbi:MAG TPA: 5'/3'-nucleotidase SurE [Spirochaetia bacterium]|nr:5'/3'-nucleotidase SurE [Spirochaetia bacterium]